MEIPIQDDNKNRFKIAGKNLQLIICPHLYRKQVLKVKESCARKSQCYGIVEGP